MDEQRFDSLARFAGNLADRRAALRGLAGLSLGALLGAAARDAVDAADDADASGKKKGKKGKGKSKRRPFSVQSTHEVTQAAEAGCNNPNGPSSGVCTTTFGGDGTASGMGKVSYASSFTSNWSQAFEDGEGNLCAPVSGTVTLRAKSSAKKKKGSVALAVVGNVCQSDEVVGYPLLLAGTYTVSGGKGAYKGATGKGTATGSVAGAGAGEEATFEADGTIMY